MNRKVTGILTVVALAAMSFAQAPATTTAATEPAPAATEVAPVAEAPAAAPAAETVPATEVAPAAEPVAENAPVVETAAPAESVEPEAAAPVAVRGGETQAPPAAAVEPVEEPAVVVAPKAVRGAGKSAPDAERPRNTSNTVYYETVYTREDGVPVRTVYVAQRESKDTVTMDKLMGLKPMTFKIGASGSVGAYQISGSDWDSDRYDGISWRAGLMSIIPLNEYTMGVKVGVLYDQSEASESYYVNGVPTSYKFKQKKIDIPVMFTFKAASSRVFFDIGTQMGIPLYDKLKTSYTTTKGDKVNSRTDLIDEDYRNAMDWDFLFGFSIMANKYVSLDVHADIGISNLYEGHMKYMNMDMSGSSFNVGLTLYPF